MIMKDAVTDLILKMDVFINKKGQDMTIRREVIKALDAITGEDSLDSIYINEVDNFNIPDVAVIPLYNRGFNLFLLDGDLSNTCPFGYTIEIHKRCFEKYTPEELSAVILHDILQNVQSCTAKVRFMKAYNSVISNYRNEDILDLFDDISNAEVTFMAFVDICCRPFRVPVTGNDYVGTDDVLKTMGLDDAYDSYLAKMLPMSQDTPEERIEQETRSDFRTIRTIIQSCMDKDIRHYYTMVRNGIPLVTLNNIFGSRGTTASLGFVSRKREFKHRYVPTNMGSDDAKAISESFINPKTEIELRFQVDKIIADMRYAETEAEREVILIKIKNLSIKLTKMKMNLDKKMQRNPTDQNLRSQYEMICNLLDELGMLREKTVKMDIKQKRYGVFVNYPPNYAETHTYSEYDYYQ